MSVVQYPRQPCAVNLGSSPQRVNYAVNSSFPSRKPRPSSLKRHRSYKKDLKDNMQHAALINIVAAVNEDLHARSTPKRARAFSSNHIRSNVTLISNFLLPHHEKTVSIPPSRQRMFQMPAEIVQRKPVYYKHSGDLEVRSPSQLKLLDEREAYNLRVQRNDPMKRAKLVAEKVAKTQAPKPQFVEVNFSGPDSKNTDDRSSIASRDRNSRASSGVRRLGTLKNQEERKVCDLHMCEAVDFLDDGEIEEDPFKQILDDSRKLIPPSSTPVPYLRTKTLPIIFPVKKSKTMVRSDSRSSRSPIVYKDRPLSRNLRRPALDTTNKSQVETLRCFEDLTIYSLSRARDIVVGKLVHQTENRSNPPSPRVQSTKSRSPKRLPSPSSRGRIHQAGVTPYLSNSRTIDSFESSYQARKALNEAVQRVMSGRRSIDSKGNVRLINSASSKKSCLTKSTGLSDAVSGTKNSKKVQFRGSQSSDDSAEDSLRDEPITKPVPKGGSMVLQAQNTEPKLRSFSPSIQPMSSRELLRLEKKILPAFIPPPVDMKPNYFLTGSLITVHQIKSSNSEASSDTATRASNSPGEQQNKRARDEKDCDNVEDGFVDDESETESTDDDKDDKIGFYKLVKALDRQPYEGFEHRKIRRSAGSSRSRDGEREKPTYVKVRLS